jgi:fructose-1,6-bisphosphatase/inositol monophosphatase family enzyme
LSFIEHVPGYAVSIALVSRSGDPCIGVVYDPVTQTLYSAVRGKGALRNGEHWTLPPSSALESRPLTLICDRSLVEQPDYQQMLDRLESVAGKLGLSGLQTLHKGGAVMNGCWVLENRPACYFKFPKPQKGGGCLWDFAAITCLFQEMGAIATDYEGNMLELNRSDSTFMNHRGVMFATDPAIVVELRKAL